MKSPHAFIPFTRLLGVAAFCTLVLIGVGCEDTEPAAEATWILDISASPQNLDLGPGETGDSELTALLFDELGVPQAGVGVRFNASAGVLASGGATLTTDSRGEVRDTLTTNQPSDVTAQSGSVQNSISITVSDLSPPTAALTITPGGSAGVNQSVLFSGSASSDFDGQIELYRFTINSSNPASGQPNPEFVETTATSITRTYSQAQNLDVTLEVVDDDDLTNSTSELYSIVGNLPPTAVLTPSSQTGTVTGTTGPTYRCSAEVSGCGSSDPDGSIRFYEIAWGDGQIDTIGAGGSCIFQHQYRNPAPLGGYNVTLTVYDDGDGTGVCGSTNPVDLPNCPSRESAQDLGVVNCPDAP